MSNRKQKKENKRGEQKAPEPEIKIQEPIGDQKDEAVDLILDGSILEGGGQVLRNSMSYAALLGKNITIVNVRGNRSPPGLKAQHSNGIKLVADIFNGFTQGAEIGSSRVTFYSNDTNSILGGFKFDFEADTKTAGSISLLMQVSLPCLLFAPGPSRIVYKGGTNVIMAPQVDYIAMLLQPMLEKLFHVTFQLQINKRGFFPRGGGEVQLNVEPIQKLLAFDLTDPGHVVTVGGLAYCSGSLPESVATRMAQGASKKLSKALGRQVNISIESQKFAADVAVGVGVGIILYAETSTGCRIGGSALGQKEVPAEKVGEQAAQELLNNLSHGECVDEYMQDQLIIYMALAEGVSRLKTGPLTLHTQTAIHFAQQVTGAQITVSDLGQDAFLIECQGIGYQNRFINE
eukprot:TRINITY_DN3006_c0_g1_i1.p1 TRINITY_DN3006_c0_g1~~TRINITY_DN3006_c0_g1_i1.p1  ORF type:complete len:403 (-),score=91.55 TRINITY_DN3006_c0_g1_i1:12-1220(-)